MYGRIVWRVVLGVLLVALLLGGAAALGWTAYNAGLAQGAAQSGAQLAPQAGARQPVPFYFYAPGRFHPFGFWFGMGGHPGRGPRGPFEGRRHHWREMAEEWHRQAHAGQGSEPPKESSPKP
jgi:hypothetical protein